MLFYHAFPPPRRAAPELGLPILSNIIKHGMLLCPESLVVPPNPWSDRAEPPRTTIIQRRACFTLLSQEDLLRGVGNVQGARGRRRSDEVPNHAAEFGPFAIGLDTREARELGILPVFYYYQPGADVGIQSDPGVSQDIVFRLAELRRLAIALARVEALAHPHKPNYRSPDDLERWGLSLKDEPDVDRLLRDLKQRDAELIARHLGTDRVPAWNLAEWIEIILAAFQTADSRSRSHHLAWFQQREWRLVQLYLGTICCLPLLTSAVTPEPSDIKARRESAAADILQLVPKEWHPELHLLLGTADRPFRAFVKEIIAPKQYADHVLKLAKTWFATVDVSNHGGSIVLRCESAIGY